MTRLNYCYVTAKFYVGGCFSQSNFHSQIYISLFSNTNLTFTLSVLWHICLQSLSQANHPITKIGKKNSI